MTFHDGAMNTTNGKVMKFNMLEITRDQSLKPLGVNLKVSTKKYATHEFYVGIRSSEN